ncbi:probable serine/threonine-protein kinase DDB_G0271682 isoform X5 [Amyelois transitella]|uniref:probable serine/threonine-protein kinase DDB_G0271682 isoform X5 n=1 Tax=Amyelois transitella TaxID=680683 RepID=UPI00298F82DD|nr:probable serine/threonine-protein kinase DDB_G0271682 isoform X5 [Amyelois transitella]
MGFKLVRVDKTDPCKIKLDVGTHLVGRGKFLHCDDKRVSRRHGELEVSDDAVKLTALHTNPCFYVKRNTSDRLILKQNESEDLRNGDKFGLLPVDCWYEVLYSPDDADDQGHQVENGRINTQNGVDNLDSTDVNHGIDAETIRQMDVDDDRINIDLMEAHDNGGSATVNAESSLNLAPQSSNEKNGQQDQTSNDQQLSPNESDLDQSQSLIQDLNLPQIMTSNNSEPAETIPQIDQQSSSENTIEQNGPVKIKNELLDQNSSIEQSPLKRPHPGTSDVKQEPEDTVKKIKTEGNDAPAGPSNDQNVMNIASRSRSTESTKTFFTDEVIDKIGRSISMSMDRWDHSAKSWAGTLRCLPKDQQIFAEKLINDVLFEAQMNSLRRESRVVVGLPVTVDLTGF